MLWLKQNKLYCKFLNDARTDRNIITELTYEYDSHCPIFNFIRNFGSTDWSDLDVKWHNWIQLKQYEEI